MSFGSFLRGIAAQINPFDNGRTYGSYNPPRKRRPEDQQQSSFRQPPPSQSNAVNNNDQPQLKVQRPDNLFQGLNQNLRLPGQPQNSLKVVQNNDLTHITQPQPGAVVKPQQPLQVHVVAPQALRVGNQAVQADPGARTAAPTPNPVRRPNFWDHVGNAFKTAGQTAVGAVANLPEVGLGAVRAGSGLVQGAAHIPSLATHGLTYIPRKLAGNDSAVNRVLSGVNRGVDTATSVVDKPFDFVNRNIDKAAQSYEKAVPMAAAGAQVYRREQVPLNILAGLLTLGGSTAAEAGQGYRLGEVSNPGRVTRFLDKPRVSNTENVIAKTGRVVNKKATPVVQPLMTPFRSTRTGVTKLINSRSVPTAERDLIDAGETGNVLSNTQLDELTAPPTQVPVTQRGGDVPIPVNIPRPRPVRELGGDRPGVVRIPTPEEAAVQRAANQYRTQAPGRPDQAIEGVTPRITEPFKLPESTIKASQDDLVNQYADFLQNVGEGNGVAITADGRRVSNNMRFGDTGGKRMTKAAWREEAQRQLEAGKADPSIQKAFDESKNPEIQSLLAKGEQTDAPEGRPIAVKQVTGIPVQDQTVVPQNLPETPGMVRATTNTQPMNARSEVVAAQTPVALPKEVQKVLDNPKQYNKRQVAAARNQRKLAKQYAKTQEDIAAATTRATEAQPASQGNPGFVPTGEFRKGENGNVSQVAHGEAEAAQAASDTANLSSGDVMAKAQQDIAQNGVVSPESVRNLQAMLDSGRFTQTSSEYRAMAKTLYGAGSDYGRGLSLFNPTLRRTASGDQLTNRFVSKLYGVAEDGSKLTDSHVAMVSNADNTFTAARDAANQALDRYNATKSATDFTAWKQARQAADEAEKHALITEYRVANEVLKGNRDPAALKAVQEAEKKAGVYQMDWIDSSMLSGTGTFARNAMNTSLIRLENATFGRLPGGGRYSGKGAKLGTKAGNRTILSDFKARNELDQNKLSKVVKQWSTTGNTLSEGQISAVGSARAYRFYENQLKAQGVKGDQLARDTEVMLHSDPDKMAEHYQQWALSENALSSLSHNNKKIEQQLVDVIASKIGSQTAAKAVVRLTVGFPTVIGRSLLGGAKRATLGLPELGMAGRALAKGDKQAAADLLYNAKIHGGSGAALYGLGTVLASAGLVSPSYPTDPAEQARWKAEGIQPNSIKIGGNWFGIPGFFGALALPLVIPANVEGKSSPADVAKGIVSGLQDLSPTSGVINFVDGIEGRSGKQWVKNEVASLTRAATPVGSLLNEIAKMTDPTKNDTTTKDAIHNVLDAIAGGIPGVNNAVDKLPATDANGNILHNPNPVATFFGAQGADQHQGIEDTKNAQGQANSTYKQLTDYGVTQDKTLMGLVDKKIQAQIARGEDLSPEDVKKVQKAVVKGVSDSGEDTAYLEKGEYDTNLAVLKVKRDLMKSDPTVKPSSLKDLDTSIKRGEIYKEQKIPYDLISDYKSTSVSEWRAMGDPENDAYDPDMYQTLWNIDQLMAKAGVSYKKGALDKNKYSAKQKKGRAGGRGSRGSYSSAFGTLKPTTGVPTVQQYESIDAKSGAVPHISVVRPNIVHKITSSG